jgi:hypothetical protein
VGLGAVAAVKHGIGWVGIEITKQCARTSRYAVQVLSKDAMEHKLFSKWAGNKCMLVFR